LGDRWLEHTVTEAESGLTVQEVLTGPLQISRRRIQKLTRSRGIRHNRRPAFLGRRVKTGDVIAARAAADEDSGLHPVPMRLDILYEDADILVLDKPAFLLVHPAAPHHQATLAHGIAHHYRERGVRAKVRPVHRLDRATSGLLLVARTAVAHQRLDAQLRQRQLLREYLALVAGVVAQADGTLEAPIGRHPQNPHLRSVRADGQPARTRFHVVERYASATLLRVRLDTGRTHQVRVHLAHSGFPVLGDRAYGGPMPAGLRRPALHASRLAFSHPSTGEALSFESPLPADLAQLQQKLPGSRPA
jgi:23S rRNA pseudouridine1911/1915/1917 synthase